MHGLFRLIVGGTFSICGRREGLAEDRLSLRTVPRHPLLIVESAKKPAPPPSHRGSHFWTWLAHDFVDTVRIGNFQKSDKALGLARLVGVAQNISPDTRRPPPPHRGRGRLDGRR